MAIQTTVHVSLLQKLLGYFELAATIGTELPEPHVQLISKIIDLVVGDIEKIAGGAQPLGGSVVTPVSDPTLPNEATLHIAPTVNVEKPAVVPAGEAQTTVALGVTVPW